MHQPTKKIGWLALTYKMSRYLLTKKILKAENNSEIFQYISRPPSVFYIDSDVPAEELALHQPDLVRSVSSRY